MNSFTRLRPVTRTLYFRREGYTQKIVCFWVAKRMTGWKHELKLKPMASDRIQELALDFAQCQVKTPCNLRTHKNELSSPVYGIVNITSIRQIQTTTISWFSV